MFDSFKKFSRELQENSLYTTDAERALLVADKDRVAAAFMFNFLGMLGMINAATPAQRGTVLKFLRKDKQVRLSSIGDDNHDLSLAVKLAHEAGLFKQDVTANEITKFLFKLKSGQIDKIDSAVVAGWLKGMVPSFRTHLKDPKMRQLFDEFVKDGGNSIDVSRFAVELKKRANKIGDGGDYQRYAKRFFGLTEITPQQSSSLTTIPDPDVVVTGPSIAAPAVDMSSPAAPVTSQPAAPKLSYYQRQRQKKQAELAAAQEVERKNREEEEARRQAEIEAAKQAALKNVDYDQILRAMLPAIAESYGYGWFSRSLDIIKQHVNLPQVNTTDDLPDDIRDFHQSLSEFVVQFKDLATEYSRSDSIRSFRVVLDEVNRKITNKLTMTEFVEANILHFRSSTDTQITNVKLYHLSYLVFLTLNFSLGDSYTKQLLEIIKEPEYVFIAYGSLPSSRLKKQLMTTISQMQSLTSSIDAKDAVRSVSRSWSSDDIVISNPDRTTVFLFDYIAAQDDNFIGEVYRRIKVEGSRYTEGGFVYMLVGYGSSSYPSIEHGIINDESFIRVGEMFRYFIKNEMIQNYSDTIIRKIFSSSFLSEKEKYDPQAPGQGGILLQVLHDTYARDVETNGFAASKLGTLVDMSVEMNLKKVTRVLSLDLTDMAARFKNDPSVILATISVNGFSGLDSSTVADVVQYSIDSAVQRSSTFSDSIGAIRQLRSRAAGDKEETHNAIARAMLEMAKRGDKYINFNVVRVGGLLMDSLANSSSETTLEWMRFAKTSNKKYIMSSELYKAIDKSDKSAYVEVLTGIILDSVGTDVEDHVNNIIEELAPHVKQKIRTSLVGSQVLIDEIQKGEIQPFDKVDNSRLKKIFLYNDINMTAITSGVVEKKKKSESYTEYFKRAREAISQKKGFLAEPRVIINDSIDTKSLNKTVIQRDHAGRHGDIFPKIIKVFDGTLKNNEFDQFRDNNFGDGTVTPAYHGTGGIAAGMILRYGFKVIKSSDASVVGRMLGDGIYFSNKVDKAMQYVSNGGYSRQRGQKGYLILMDVNLGRTPQDYRVAGLGNDAIRSPEWCVFDPVSQLRVMQVYEVELNTKQNVDSYLAESVYSNGRSTFKQYITEQAMSNYQPTTTFVFRDGMIPIVDVDTQDVTYVDFEVALRDGLLPQELYDVTSQGPAVMFSGTSTTEVYDERYASHLVGDGLQLYKQLFVGFKKSN